MKTSIIPHGLATSPVRAAHPFCAALLLAGALSAGSGPAVSEIAVKDDQGETVRLARAATRIVSLAPGPTEMVYAAGAGDRMVGTVEFSNYPEAARALPLVGNSAVVDVERIAALKPDLVIAWPHGAGQRQAAQLRRLGMRVYMSDPKTLDDIASTLEAFGRLAGTEPQAQAAARLFRSRLKTLREVHAAARPLGVFVQIWRDPLMTVNDRHLIADALRACGARNVFGGIVQLAPTITREAVIAADPEVIVVVAKAADAVAALDAWRKWPQLQAVRRERMFAIDPDRLSRLTPRAIDGTTDLCEKLQHARRQERS